MTNKEKLIKAAIKYVYEMTLIDSELRELLSEFSSLDVSEVMTLLKEIHTDDSQ
ncbi:hypothetical protein D3C79_634470 [compost metagenome]